MAIELQLPPKFQLVRDELLATVMANDGAINVTNFPVASAIRPGAVDRIACYWDANKDGSHLAAAGDTITLEILIWSGVEQAWVVGGVVNNLGWRVMCWLPAFQAAKVHFRKTDVVLADAAAAGFELWAVKQIGPLAL